MTTLLGITIVLVLLLLFLLVLVFAGRPKEHMQIMERLIDIQHQIDRMERSQKIEK